MSLPILVNETLWQAEYAPGRVIVRIAPTPEDLLAPVVRQLLTRDQRMAWSVTAGGTDEEGWAIWVIEKDDLVTVR
jgi:hypothetical protein